MGRVWGEYLRLLLEDDHAAPLVPGGQQLPSVVELNSGDDVSCQSQARAQLSSTQATSGSPPHNK